MIEPTELAALLAKLKRKAPDMYRHLIGMIRAALNIARDL